MSHPSLPISALPVWAALNSVDLGPTTVRDANSHHQQQHDGNGNGNGSSRGLGLFMQRAVSSSSDNSNTAKPVTLLKVPVELVLSSALVDEYAKAEVEFRHLLDAVDRRNPRMDMLLFLLAQLLRARSPPHPTPHTHHSPHKHLPAPTPWAEYIRFLPPSVPLPTLWPASSTSLLRGTTLAPAVGAKLRALEGEFTHLASATRNLPFWDDLLWQADDDNNVPGGLLLLEDWVLLDAWFRSRSLEVPGLGVSMVPVLDMANHAGGGRANAYFERVGDAVALLLRPGCAVAEGEEITISYGDDKSTAEMLFSYGFVDTPQTQTHTTTSMVIPVSSIVLDDPLAKAKIHVFPTTPTLTLTSSSSPSSPSSPSSTWSCPFAHLAVLNHEDGLTFQLLRSTTNDDYSDELRVFWQDNDVTERAGDFESLVHGHALEKVFKLRVSVTLGGVLREQLGEMEDVERQWGVVMSREEGEMEGGDGNGNGERMWAERLRVEQMDLVRAVVGTIEEETERLVGDEGVRAYLASQKKEEEEGDEGEGVAVEGQSADGDDDSDEFA